MFVTSRSNLEINFTRFKDLLFHSHFRYNYKNIENEFTSNTTINVVILKLYERRLVNNMKYSIISSGFCCKTVTEEEREVRIKPYRSQA